MGNHQGVVKTVSTTEYGRECGEREREWSVWGGSGCFLNLPLTKIFVSLRTHQELALGFIEMTEVISPIQITLPSLLGVVLRAPETSSHVSL